MEHISDFAIQHEAVRNAFRIALETNRTLILPQLRLGTKDIPWAPFPLLQNYYGSQDKNLLKQLCSQGRKSWQTELQPCRDLNSWVEVPWSTLFDLTPLTKKFKIRIIERTEGHGWGINEPSLLHLQLKDSDITILDPNSFPSNGSDWNSAQKLDQQRVMSNKNFNFFSGFNRNKPTTEYEESLKLKGPLKNLVTAKQLGEIKEKYIQFGTLVYGLRFETSKTKQQITMAKALKTNTFVTPNQLEKLNDITQSIVHTLGGTSKFNMIHMNIETITKIELQNQIMLKKEAAEIEGKKFVNKIVQFYPDGSPYSKLDLLIQLDNQTQTDLMASLVRELHGDMPINQAISAVLPFKESILKKLMLTKPIRDRKALLDACVDYKKKHDSRYPIYYLQNDVYSDITQHPELFNPLLKIFPCTFTINDICNWGVVERKWAEGIFEKMDHDVDYELILSQVLEILIARKGKP